MNENVVSWKEFWRRKKTRKDVNVLHMCSFRSSSSNSEGVCDFFLHSMKLVFIYLIYLSFVNYSKYTNMITFFVEEYFNSHDQINSQEIAALENEIRAAVKASVDSLKSAREASKQSQQSNDRSATGSRNDQQNEVICIFLLFYFHPLY